MSPSCGRCTRRDVYNYRNSEDENKHFLMLMLGDFQQQMIIPKEYVRCLKGEIPGEINLETRNRDSYTIKVAKNKEKHVLTAGWPQFVENFHLQLGDSLLFRYNGDSLFSIIIFDKLGREKASSVLVDPFPPQVQGRHNEIGSSKRNLFSVSRERSHERLNLKQRINVNTKFKLSRTKKSSLCLQRDGGACVQKFSLEIRDRIILFRYNGNSRFSVIILDELGREKASSVVNLLPPRALERHTNGAETVSRHPSDGPVDCSHPPMLMPPPAQFHHQQQAILMQPPLNHSSSSKSSAGQGDGSFSSHDHVRNALGFRRVVRRNPTSSQKQQEKDGYITTDKTKLTSAQEQRVKDMVQTIRSRRSGITIFVALIGKANVHPAFSLTVPITYGEEHFGDGKVICFQLGEKKWNACFSSSRNDYRIERGWSTFVKDNSLNIGDICLLEPLSNQGSTMEVHIIHVNNDN
ncbi:hypothetical protein VPH35_056509 [Triticum aestivum]